MSSRRNGGIGGVTSSGSSSGRRESSFGLGWGAAGGLASLGSDALASHLEKEREYYAREEDKIEQTIAHMHKCHAITEQMLSILDSFDDKLNALESSMLPIHKGTTALTTAQKNIDATLAETETIIRHYSVATESEESLSARRLNSIDYLSYLEWVERIHAAIAFFQRNKERLGAGERSLSATSAPGLVSQSDVEKYLASLKKLSRRAMGEIEAEFERVLAASSKNPLDLSRTGWPLVGSVGADGSPQPFQLVPDLSVRELSALATRMAIAQHHNYFGIILTQRSAFLKASLKKLFHEEVKFVVNAGGSAAVAAAPSPSSTSGGGAPSPQVHMHMRGSIIQTSGSGVAASHVPGSSLDLSSSTHASTVAVGQLYRKNTHRSVFYLDFFLKLLELESAFLLRALAHMLSDAELRANGLPPPPASAAREECLSLMASAQRSQAPPKLTNVGSTASLLSSSGASILAHPSGGLTAYWGQEAWDTLVAHVFDVPLEYFRRKLEQSTYLKDAGLLKLGSVFQHVGASVTGKDTPLGSGTPHHASASSTAGLSMGAQLGNKILILLDVLEHLTTLMPRYRLLLKRTQQFEQLSDVGQGLTSLARKSIAEYRAYMLEYNEKSAASGMLAGASKRTARDGTIYTLTVETLNFIRRLYEYRRIVEATPNLLDKHQQGTAADRERMAAASGGSAATSDAGGKGGGLLDERGLPLDDSPLTALVSFLLSGLESNLEAKSRSLRPASLSAVFLLNNLHYACRYLKKHEGVFLAAGAAGNLARHVDRYERLTHASMKQYRTCSWERVVSQALETSDMQDLSRALATAAPGSSAQKAARKAIKNKFALFNSVFEELYNTQRYFSIPDSDLRSQLRNDNVELIMPSYKQLYNTFSGVEFTSNQNKYIKYKPDVLETKLNQFFDEEERT